MFEFLESSDWVVDVVEYVVCYDGVEFRVGKGEGSGVVLLDFDVGKDGFKGGDVRVGVEGCYYGGGEVG